MNCPFEEAAVRFPGSPRDGWRWLNQKFGIQKVWTEVSGQYSSQDRGIRFPSAKYPVGLRQLSDPPPFLFIRGDIPETNLKVAVVGARETDAYGRAMGFQFSRSLAERGITVVSGGAQGVDTAAHLGAMSVQGTTICVQAGAVDSPVPKINRKIFEQIVLGGGAIISENPRGIALKKYFFLRRNRLIAALSDALVVVSARRCSGSLSTARWANNLGKPVFAVPGDLQFGLSEGVNALIASGQAMLLHHPQQIIDHLQQSHSNLSTIESFNWPCSREHRRMSPGPDWTKTDHKGGIETQIYCESELTKSEKNMVDFFSEKPRTAEEFSSHKNMPLGRVISLLEVMVLSGKILRTPGERYVLSSRYSRRSEIEGKRTID